LFDFIILTIFTIEGIRRLLGPSLPVLSSERRGVLQEARGYLSLFSVCSCVLGLRSLTAAFVPLCTYVVYILEGLFALSNSFYTFPVFSFTKSLPLSFMFHFYVSPFRCGTVRNSCVIFFRSVLSSRFVTFLKLFRANFAKHFVLHHPVELSQYDIRCSSDFHFYHTRPALPFIFIFVSFHSSRNFLFILSLMFFRYSSSFLSRDSAFLFSFVPSAVRFLHLRRFRFYWRTLLCYSVAGDFRDPFSAFICISPYVCSFTVLFVHVVYLMISFTVRSLLLTFLERALLVTAVLSFYTPGCCVQMCLVRCCSFFISLYRPRPFISFCSSRHLL